MEMRQYMECMNLEAKKHCLKRNPDAEDDEDEEEDDDEDKDDRVGEEVREEWEKEKLQVIEEDALCRKAARRILDYDPKQEGLYYTRIFYVNHHTFDLDEECEYNLTASHLSVLPPLAKLPRCNIQPTILK
jgi:hypothetical protein